MYAISEVNAYTPVLVISPCDRYWSFQATVPKVEGGGPIYASYGTAPSVIVYFASSISAIFLCRHRNGSEVTHRNGDPQSLMVMWLTTSNTVAYVGSKPIYYTSRI